MPPLIPSRLRIARELRRLTQTELAQTLGVTRDAVSKYESGRNSTDGFTIRRISQVLRVPEAFLTEGNDIESVPEGACFYRGKARIPAREKRYVEAAGGIARLLMEHLESRYVQGLPRQRIPIIRLPSAEASTPEEAAEFLRREWGLGDGPIRSMIDLLEYKGVWVHVLFAGASPDIDAYSYWADGRPNVVLNYTKQDAYRSRLDSAHEIFHLMAHDESDEGERVREDEANAFAGAFLMPRSSWPLEAPRSTNPNDYLPLKSRWKVSVGAMLYRNYELGILSKERFTSAMVRYSSLGWRRGEPGMRQVMHEQPRLLDLCLNKLLESEITIHHLTDEIAVGSDLLAEVIGAERAQLGPRPLPASVARAGVPAPEPVQRTPNKEAREVATLQADAHKSGSPEADRVGGQFGPDHPPSVLPSPGSVLQFQRKASGGDGSKR